MVRPKKRLRLVPGKPLPRRTQVVKCITYPNRAKPRLFTTRQAASIVCRVMRAGYTNTEGKFIGGGELESEMRLYLNECISCADSREQRSPTKQVAALAAQALAVVQENATVIAIALAVLAALAFLPRLIPALPLVLLRTLPFAATGAAAALPSLIVRLRSAQAANDALFRLVSGLR